jgi:polysaccharide transporter, PST family
VSGAGQEEAVKILNWLCLAMLFGIGSLLSPLLIIQGQDARLIQITTVSMVVNLIMVYPMILNFGGVGVAMTFLFTQSVQTILQLYANDYIFPNKLNSNKKI